MDLAFALDAPALQLGSKGACRFLYHGLFANGVDDGGVRNVAKKAPIARESPAKSSTVL
jgi:hypothetical protein